MRIRPIRLLAIATALSLPFVLGCGGAKTYPVEGIVVYKDGTPVTGGIVTFELVGDGPAKECARGEIGPDGTFQLRTFARNDGALAGKHRVIVAPPPALGKSASPTESIHPRFANYDTSGLQFTVTSGKNHFRIEVERP